MNDAEGELLNRVAKLEDFFGLFLRDNLDDWNLAKDFGELLIRLDPEEAMGHALLARAYRHMGNSKRSLEALESCRARIAHPSEVDLFKSFLAEEERLQPRHPDAGEEK
jgi:hypothetical protein